MANFIRNTEILFCFEAWRYYHANLQGLYVGKYVFDRNNEIVIRKSFFVDENVVIWNGRFENKRLIVLVEIINTKCKEFDWF